jgi:hypothetical protein
MPFRRLHGLIDNANGLTDEARAQLQHLASDADEVLTAAVTAVRQGFVQATFQFELPVDENTNFIEQVVSALLKKLMVRVTLHLPKSPSDGAA